MPTLVQLTQTADVIKLKCLFFNLVKELKEVDWYGIKCNRSILLDKIKKALSYITLLSTNCVLSYELDCEIKSFISKNTSFCIYTDNSCGDTITIVSNGIIG